MGYDMLELLPTAIIHFICVELVPVYAPRHDPGASGGLGWLK